PDPFLTPGDGEMVLPLEIVAEPKLRWQRTVSIQDRQDIDEHGQKLEAVLGAAAPAPAPAPVLVRPPNNPNGGMFKMSLNREPGPAIRLKKGEKSAHSLREISGTITAQVQDAAQPLVTV